MPRQPMIAASPITSGAIEHPYRAEPWQPAHFSPLPRRHRYASTAIAEVSSRASHGNARPRCVRASLTVASTSTPSGCSGKRAGWRNAPREVARGPRRRANVVTATANAAPSGTRGDSPPGSCRQLSGINQPAPERGSVRPGALQFPRKLQVGSGRAPLALSGTGLPTNDRAANSVVGR